MNVQIDNHLPDTSLGLGQSVVNLNVIHDGNDAGDTKRKPSDLGAVEVARYGSPHDQRVTIKAKIDAFISVSVQLLSKCFEPRRARANALRRLFGTGRFRTINHHP